MTHLNYSLTNLGGTLYLQEELLKTQMNHNEVDGNDYKDKNDEWLDYVKQDVLCTAFSYARYGRAMEEITGFGMKDCLSLPSIGWKCFNSLRTEEDEPMYTYKDKHLRSFVRQPIKGGRVCSFKHDSKSKLCDNILKIISEEVIVKGNIFDIIEAYLKYKNKHFKILEKDYESKFNDYCDEDVEKNEKFINEKLSKLPIHQLMKQIKLDELLWDFDNVSLYPSAMWDEKSICPRNATCYADTKDMNDELVESFNSGIFN